MKRVCITAFFTAAMLFLCSCAAKVEYTEKAISDFSESEFDTDTQDFIDVQKYDIPVVYPDEEYAEKYKGTYLEGMESKPLYMLYFAESENSIYFIYEYDILTTMSTDFDIYCLDKSTNNYSLVKKLRYDDQTAIFSVTCSEGALYFSSYNTSDQWEITELSFSSHETRIIDQGTVNEYSRIPCIAYDDGYLTWYSADDKSTDLISFNLNGGQKETVAENVLSSNPYERTAGLAYAVSDDGAVTVFHNNNQTKLGSYSGDFYLAAAENGRVAWRVQNENSGYKTAYFLNTSSGKILTETAEKYMGSGIIGDYFYIHTSDGDLKIIDSESEKSYTLRELGTSWAYSLSDNSVGIMDNDCVYIITAR